MGLKITNNAFGTLAASINDSVTSITVASGQGARFPTLGAGDYFYATLINISNEFEIVKCTARTGDVLTVTRAQDGTTARAYTVGDRLEIRPVAAIFDEKADVGADVNVSQITGVLPTSKGGTNNGSLAVTAGGALYTDGSKVVNVGAGTSGQVLQSNGSSAPSWETIDISTSSMTLLGTVTASGNSSSLSSLNLTSYTALFIVVNAVSAAQNIVYPIYVSSNNAQSGGRIGVLPSAGSSTMSGNGWLDLTYGTISGAAIDNNGTNVNTGGGKTNVTTSSTIIYFRLASTGNMDAGSFLVYGVK